MAHNRQDNGKGNVGILRASRRQSSKEKKKEHCENQVGVRDQGEVNVMNPGVVSSTSSTDTRGW
jgi:hypothetical protein